MSSTISGLNAYLFPNTLDNLSISDEFGDNFLKLDGSNAMNADLDAGGHNVKNLADATANDEAVNLGQITTTLGNYVDLTSLQYIGGQKIFFDGVDGAIGLLRNGTGRSAQTGYFDQTIGVEWTTGTQGDTTRNFYIIKNNTIPLFNINYSSGYTEAINNISGISIGWSNTSPATLNLGSSTRTGCLRLQGTLGYSTIQATTNNLHLDTSINSGNGIYLNWFSADTNTFINSSAGSGCILAGGSTPNITYKMVVDKGTKARALLVNGDTQINGELNMTGGKIINVGIPTSTNDAANKNYVDSNFVTLATNQTIAGIKQIYNSVGGSGILGIARTGLTDVRALRYLNSVGSSLWSLGNEGNNTEDLIISKNGTTPVLTINYTTPNLSMNNYKIVNLLDPTNAQDAATKNYIDNNFMGISTDNTITGLKTFSNTSLTTSAFIHFQRTNDASFAFTRYIAAGGGFLWDVGMDSSTFGNQFYWFNQSTRVMTLSTTGNLNLTTGNFNVTAGNMRIGSGVPTYALEITKAGVNTTFTTGFRFGSGGQGANPAGGITDPINVRSTAGMWAIIYYATSDARIKKNIKEVNDDEALKVVRKLKPVSYSYVDTVRRKNGIEYGFIAQDVKEVLPNAVREETDFIPDIYDLADFEIVNNNTIINLRNKDTKNIKEGDIIKLIDLAEIDLEYKVIKINNLNSFIIEEDLSKIISKINFTEEDIKNNINENTLFVYGKKVNDLNVLDKNAIFSVSVAAIQELDRRHKKQQKEILDLQNKYNDLITLLQSKNII